MDVDHSNPRTVGVSQGIRDDIYRDVKLGGEGGPGVTRPIERDAWQTQTLGNIGECMVAMYYKFAVVGKAGERKEDLGI